MRATSRQPRRASGAILLAVSFALIGLMTLQPTQAIIDSPTFCIFCGSLGGVDFILNVVLFIPLGLALRWTTGRWWTAAIIGLATTVVIESLQWRLISGRDATIGDLLANALGTLVGAWLAVASIQWLNATGVAARRLAAAFGIAASLIVMASAFVLQPLVPRYPQWVQWTPLRRITDPFRGQLLAVEVKGRSIRARESFESWEEFDSLTRRLTVRAHIGAPGPGPTQRLAIIVRTANDLEEGFLLGQRGDAAVFRSHMVAERVKLRSTLVGLDKAFPRTSTNSDTGAFIIEGQSDPRGISVRRQSEGTSTVSVRRTVGLAWTLLLPWDIALNERWWLANAIWLSVLLLPVSFFAVRTSRSVDNSHPGFWWWPLALVVVTVIATPATGLSPLGIGEWAGIAAGIAAGWILELWLPPRVAET